MSTTTPLLIVCAWCERVRTSSDRWEEVAPAERGPEPTTHGICPDCLLEAQRAALLTAEYR
jgi:hypothetical protein